MAVVVLNWNRAEDTAECLTSLRDSTYPRLVTLVVDNGSTDDSVKLLANRFPEPTLLQNQTNLGYAEGNNGGIRWALAAGADYVLLLNDDARVDPDAVWGLVKVAEADPHIGIAGPKIYYWDQPEAVWFAGGVLDWRTGYATHLCDGPPSPYDTDFVTGCVMLVRARLFEEIGLFDPRFFLYYEDTDLCLRARRAGWRTVVVPAAGAWHKIRASGEAAARSSYYSFRNRALLASKCLSPRERAPFACRYAADGLRQYRYLTHASRHEEAEAVLDGVWSAVRGRYGAERAFAPAWLKASIKSGAADSLARLIGHSTHRRSTGIRDDDVFA